MKRPVAIVASIVISALGVAHAAPMARQVPRSVALPEGTVLGKSARPVVSGDGVVGFLAPSLGDTVFAFNVVTGDVVGTVPGHGGASGLAIAETGRRRLLAVTSPNDPLNGVPATVTVVDATTPSRMQTATVFTLPSSAVLGPEARAELLPQGNFGIVAIEGPTPALVTFDVVTGKQAGALVLEGPLASIAVAHDGATTRVLGPSPTTNGVAIFEVGAYGEILPVGQFGIPDDHRLTAASTVALGADGRIGFVATHTGGLFSFDVATGSIVDRLVAGARLGGVTAYHAAEGVRLATVTLAAGPDSHAGALLASATAGGTLTSGPSFVMESGDEVDGAHRAEFSADGRTVVIASRSAIYFVDVEKAIARRQPLPREAGHLASAPLAGSVAVLTSGGGGDVVEILPIDVETPAEVESELPAEPAVAAVATPAPTIAAPVAPLRIDRISPSSVERGRAQLLFVTILGSGLAPGAVAVVRGTEFPLTVEAGGTRALAALPPALFGEGSRLAIEIANPDGTVGRPLEIYIIDPKVPAVSSVTAKRTRSGAVDLDVRGQHFRNGAVVRIKTSDGARIDLRSYRLTFERIVAEIPASTAASGSIRVEVVDRDGTTISAPASVVVGPIARAVRRSSSKRVWRETRRAALRPRRSARQSAQ